MAAISPQKDAQELLKNKIYHRTEQTHIQADKEAPDIDQYQ
jgi:hypothetical protein